VNAGEIFEPLISKQLEAGIKTSVADMLLTAALFNIDKPLEYYRILNEKDAEFVQDGRQVHQGLELTATGKITPDLTLMGGLTWLDAEVKENEQFPEYEGKRPVAVAEEMVKAYVEYQIRAVPGLSLNGGWSYTGNFYGDQLNTDKMPGYMLVDAGARYFTEVANNALTLRLNINNLTDEHYWANQYFLGDPRAILFSVNLTL
jgi:iron complex outermembrane recepter protein